MNEASVREALAKVVDPALGHDIISYRMVRNVEKPRGTMFVWAPIPEAYCEMRSLEFSSFLVKEANVATSPGDGFGPGGDRHVRFALIENEQRTKQAIRNLRRSLTKLG